MPVIIGGEVSGIIALCEPQDDYSARDMAVLARLVNLYALAIQRMRMEDDLRAAKEKAEKEGRAKSAFFGVHEP